MIKKAKKSLTRGVSGVNRAWWLIIKPEER